MANTTISVLFFASAREAAGNVNEIQLSLMETEANTDAVRKKLSTLYPRLSEMVLDENSITFAVNEEYLAPQQTLALHNGDVVALIPPISGG